jgi:hypothetical protein
MTNPIASSIQILIAEIAQNSLPSCLRLQDYHWVIYLSDAKFLKQSVVKFVLTWSYKKQKHIHVCHSMNIFHVTHPSNICLLCLFYHSCFVLRWSEVRIWDQRPGILTMALLSSSRVAIQIRPRPIPYTCFPVYYSLIIASFNAIRAQLLIAPPYPLIEPPSSIAHVAYRLMYIHRKPHNNALNDLQTTACIHLWEQKYCTNW